MRYDDHGHPYHFKVLGIPVNVGWQFFLLVLWGIGPDPIATVLWVAIIFGSVLLHEMGHALAYRRFGSDPRIQLWAFGGLTYGSRTPARWQEVVVVAAGPIPPLVLIGIPSAVALWNGVGDGSPLLTTVLWYLTFANLFMSVLNLLPIMPLDGGRLVDAAFGRAGARIVSALFGLSVAGVGLWWESRLIVGVGAVIGLFNLFMLATEIGNGVAVDPVKRMAKQARKDAGLGRRGKVPVAGGAVGEAWHAIELDDDAGAVKALGRAASDGEEVPALLDATMRARRGDLAGAAERYADSLLAGETGPPKADQVMAASGAVAAVASALAASTDARADAALGRLHDRMIARSQPALAAHTAEVMAGRADAGAGPLWYAAAQAWGRAGDADRALAALDRAAATGHAKAITVAADPAFSTVFDAPGFAARVRALDTQPAP